MSMSSSPPTQSSGELYAPTPPARLGASAPQIAALAEDGDAQTNVLALQTGDVRYFLSLLKGLAFASSRLASVTITHTGLVVAVEEARSVTATAWIFKDVFDIYTYTPPPPPAPAPSPEPEPTQPEPPTTALEIPLRVLLDCLGVFSTAGSSGEKRRGVRPADDDGDGEPQQRGLDAFLGGGVGKRTGMSMLYGGAGHPLTIQIADAGGGGPSAKVEISTFDAEGIADIALDYANTTLKIILKSSWLHAALSELDPKEYDVLTLVGSPPAPPGGTARVARAPAPVFRILASGAVGTTELDYPDDRAVLESVEASEPVRARYRLSHVRGALGALGASSRTSLRVDAGGVLSLQFLVPPPAGARVKQGATPAYIDFLCLPLDEGF